MKVSPTKKDPQTWIALCWRLITEWPVHAIIICMLALVVGGVAALLLAPRMELSIGGFHLRPPLAASPPGPPRVTVPSSFANFNSVWPNANTGVDWQIFNDNKFLGRSSVWYETVPNPGVAGDHVLRVHFSLDRGLRSMVGDAYAGIFIDLNPPLGSANLSQYSGISFRAGCVEDPSAKRLRFYVNLANPDIRNYAYHEIEFTDRLHRDGSLTPLSVPFMQLRQPEWTTATDRVSSFDTSSVYRLSFFVKGDHGAGYFDLDDIEFIVAQC